MGANQEKLDQSAIDAFQNSTNLGSVPVAELEHVFQTLSTKGKLDQAHFEQALAALEKFGLKKIAHTPLSTQLYRVFDRDRSGSIEIGEWIAGAGLLSNGTVEQKAEVTFRAFDIDNNGYIDKRELLNMVMQSYDLAVKLALSVSDLHNLDSMTNTVVSSVRYQMEKVVEDTMRKLDANHDGKLDMKEFKQFCVQVEDIKATVNGLNGKVNVVV